MHYFLNFFVNLGHNMSQVDANSLEGEAREFKPTTTGTGCYKNYDHTLFSKSRKNSAVAAAAPNAPSSGPRSPSKTDVGPGSSFQSAVFIFNFFLLNTTNIFF